MNRKFKTAGAPHFPPQTTVTRVMLQVLIALIPAIAAHVWFFGPGILFQITLAVGFAVGFEAMMLKARHQPVRLFLGDLSAVLTAVLFALCIPPLAPWWISLIGMLFAIVVAKHLYGGLGNNLFNPAMVGYVVVLISFPQAMTAWLPPVAIAPVPLGIMDTLAAILGGKLPGDLTWDAITGATPLDLIRTSVASGEMISEARSSPVFGDFGGLGWEWIANWYAVGGIWLLWRRVIGWHVPVTMIGSVLLLGLIAWLTDPGSNPSPLQHVFSGALMIGAFFIATDPVSGCASTRGRLIFGAGVGIITLVIRRWGGYPDGVAFAVLLMNMAAPLIDRYTRPRIFGR
ncbi:MAG: electron transport complex subunit RsxD [Xanthomonadales bacterium]|nr:electron transport complex subunit RsxD [Gammaproteobacteria bacterium]MBT8053313.1 electron transport complex subunit RsxD [Gammaproteobacteria bacterium]NND58025.1 electron transport complex subunit RsxD [Xanthomonadales bacterium]NNK52122.1 electron transport complex subunit RsxD [Xanthomonadales bacterium]